MGDGQEVLAVTGDEFYPGTGTVGQRRGEAVGHDAGLSSACRGQGQERAIEMIEVGCLLRCLRLPTSAFPAAFSLRIQAARFLLRPPVGWRQTRTR